MWLESIGMQKLKLIITIAFQQCKPLLTSQQVEVT